MSGRRFPVLRDYELLAELGRGTLGSTYKALSLPGRELHAVKVIDGASEELRLRLKRDVRALARLEHPQLVRIYDLIEDGPHLLVVSEYVEGRDMLSALGSAVAADPERLKHAIFAFAQLAKTLAHVHGQGLVHRGIKPANVLISDEGKVKLADCGLSRQWSLAVIECLPPEMSVAAAYHAPEQLAGRPLDARVDLYQTGLLLYEVLSGRRPQSGATLLALLRARLHDNPAPLVLGEKLVARCFAPLLDRLLARSPEGRFGSAGELVTELRQAWEALSRGEPIAAEAQLADETLFLRSAPVIAEAELSSTNTLHRVPEADDRVAAGDHDDPTSAAATDPEPTTRKIVVALPAEVAVPVPLSDSAVADALAATVSEPAPALAAALVGRSDELARLDAELLLACSGSGHVVAVHGEAGVGKTRLLEEFLANARIGGALVLAGGSDEGRRARRGGIIALLDAAARALSEMSAADRAQVLPREASALAEIADGFRLFVAPEVASGDVESEVHRRRYRLRSALTELLRNLSRRAPVVAVLEDLHAADGEGVALIESLIRGLLDRPAGERARVLPVVTYRDDEVGSEHPLGRALVNLDDNDLVARVALGRLAAEATARLAETMTGLSPAPPELVQHLQAETGGNPLYVVETIELLRDERVLVAVEGRLQLDARRLEELATGGARFTLAGGVRDAIKRRLVRLSAPALETVQLAALAGSEIEFGRLRAATGRSEEEVLDALVELLHARILIEPTDRLGSYRFDHDKTREVILGELSPRARRSLAGRLARAFEASYGGEREEHALELAALFEEAQDPDKLIEYLPAAAATAARDGDLDGSLARLTRLFELARGRDNEVLELSARRLEARVLLLAGQLDTARRRYQELVALLHRSRRGSDEVEALNGLSEAAWKTGDFAAARQAAESAAERARSLGLVQPEAAALENLGVVFRRTYDVKAASRSLREALKHYRRLGDEPGAARVLSSLGILFRNQDNYTLAATHFREAHEIYQRRRDRLGIALTLSHLASVHVRSNEFDRAVELYHEAIAIEETMGNRRGVALCREGLGYVHLTAGDYPRAFECFEAALAVFRSTGDRPNAAYSLINLGHTGFRRGAFAAAIGHYREAVALIGAIGNRVIESEARSGLALALDGAGFRAEAAAEAEAAVAVAHEHGAREKEAWARHTLSRVTGSLDQARRALELAESVHNENLIFMIHHQLAVLHLEGGEREAAREHFQRAFTLIDQLAERTGKAKEMFLKKPPVAAVFRDAQRL